MHDFITLQRARVYRDLAPDRRDSYLKALTSLESIMLFNCLEDIRLGRVKVPEPEIAEPRISVVRAETASRLSWDQHFMRLAHVTAERSSCSRRNVGVVLVRDRIILMSAYNGTPSGTLNCDEGGCPRCASEEPSFSGYGWCTCVHAEMNAVALAAHEGIRTDGATIYITLRPCMDCLKTIVQAGIKEIVFTQDYDLPDNVEPAYRSILMQKGIIYRQLV